MSNTHSVEFVSIDELADHIRIRVRGIGYQTGPRGDWTTPYGIFILPRSQKRLVLEEDVQIVINGPPVWEERARFPAVP